MHDSTANCLFLPFSDTAKAYVKEAAGTPRAMGVVSKVITLPENTDPEVLMGILRDHFHSELSSLAAAFQHAGRDTARDQF